MDFSAWRLAAAFVFRDWDGEVVLFDERSGATHRLGAGPTLLFMALHESAEPLSIEALMGAVAAQSRVAEVELRGTVMAAVTTLERLRLITATPL